MKAELIAAASQVVTNQQILVNLVSRRVRQLTLGHRPLVEFVPGLGYADIALSEIATGKLAYETTFDQNAKDKANGIAVKDKDADVVPFPAAIATKTKAKKKAA